MESLANQLRNEVLMYNKYGSIDDREIAKVAFDRVMDIAHYYASNGQTCVVFSDDVLPRKSVEYFRYLCENEELKFEVRTDRTPDGKAEYTVSWG